MLSIFHEFTDKEKLALVGAGALGTGLAAKKMFDNRNKSDILRKYGKYGKYGKKKKKSKLGRSSNIDDLTRQSIYQNTLHTALGTSAAYQQGDN